MKKELIQLLFKGILNENIVEAYSQYINNSLDWEAYGNAEPTSRVVEEGYEEWEDTCSLSAYPFTNLKTDIYVYWMFDKEKIKNIKTENYPWGESSHFMFFGRQFNTLEKLFEYIIKLYMDGNEL